MCSNTSGSQSPYAHGGSEYAMPHPTTQPSPTWVYEWQDPSFYNMMVSEWQTTAAWMGQSWQDYKAALLSTHEIAIMSTEEYNM